MVDVDTPDTGMAGGNTEIAVDGPVDGLNPPGTSTPETGMAGGNMEIAVDGPVDGLNPPGTSTPETGMVCANTKISGDGLTDGNISLFTHSATDEENPMSPKAPRERCSNTTLLPISETGVGKPPPMPSRSSSSSDGTDLVQPTPQPAIRSLADQEIREKATTQLSNKPILPSTIDTSHVPQDQVYDLADSVHNGSARSTNTATSKRLQSLGDKFTEVAAESKEAAKFRQYMMTTREDSTAAILATFQKSMVEMTAATLAASTQDMRDSTQQFQDLLTSAKADHEAFLKLNETIV